MIATVVFVSLCPLRDIHVSVISSVQREIFLEHIREEGSSALKQNPGFRCASSGLQTRPQRRTTPMIEGERENLKKDFSLRSK
jgi:hypothetical protein